MSGPTVFANIIIATGLQANLPVAGTTGTPYFCTDTGNLFIWSGTEYVQINASLTDGSLAVTFDGGTPALNVTDGGNESFRVVVLTDTDDDFPFNSNFTSVNAGDLAVFSVSDIAGDGIQMAGVNTAQGGPEAQLDLSVVSGDAITLSVLMDSTELSVSTSEGDGAFVGGFGPAAGGNTGVMQCFDSLGGEINCASQSGVPSVTLTTATPTPTDVIILDGTGTGTITSGTVSAATVTAATVNATNGFQLNGVPLGVPQVATITLSSAELASFSATPILFIPAQGANTVISPQAVYGKYTFGTTPYSVGNSDNGWNFTYGTTGVPDGSYAFWASYSLQGGFGFLDQTVSMVSGGSGGDAQYGSFNNTTGATALSTVVDQPLYIIWQGTTPSLSGGDGTVVLTMYYTVLAV